MTADTAAARAAVAAIRQGFATSSQDWSAARDGIYLYGIVLGWGPDPDDPDSVDRTSELVARSRWTEETADHIRAMRAGFAAISGLLDELDAARRAPHGAQQELSRLCDVEAAEREACAERDLLGRQRQALLDLCQRAEESGETAVDLTAIYQTVITDPADDSAYGTDSSGAPR